MYGVRFTEDHELPEGHDFAMVRTDEDTMFFVKRSKVTPRVLEQAWAAFRALPDVPEQIRREVREVRRVAV